MPSTGHPHCRPRARVTFSSLALRLSTSHRPSLPAHADFCDCSAERKSWFVTQPCSRAHRRADAADRRLRAAPSRGTRTRSTTCCAGPTVSRPHARALRRVRDAAHEGIESSAAVMARTCCATASTASCIRAAARVGRYLQRRRHSGHALFHVCLQPEGVQIATLDEHFAVESVPGDVILLGNTSWRVQRVESAGRVLVEDAHGAPPSVPFWVGEAPRAPPSCRTV